MNGGFLIYKCRRCGAEDRSTHVPQLLPALVAIQANAWPSRWGGPEPRMIDVHDCATGEYGISDLIGGDEDEK